MGTELNGIFATTAAAFVGVVIDLDDAQWERPALGEWTVRDLVGHTLRAFRTVDNFLDHPAETAEIGSAGDYYRLALAMPDIHRTVAERGREAGRSLGETPKEVVVAAVGATLLRLGDTNGDEIGMTAAGTMRIDDYLQTRLVELVVHLGDLCEAIREPFPELDDALATVAGILVSSAVSTAGRNQAVRAMLGRGGLAKDFSVWE